MFCFLSAACSLMALGLWCWVCIEYVRSKILHTISSIRGFQYLILQNLFQIFFHVVFVQSWSNLIQICLFKTYTKYWVYNVHEKIFFRLGLYFSWINGFWYLILLRIFSHLFSCFLCQSCANHTKTCLFKTYTKFWAYNVHEKIFLG